MSEAIPEVDDRATPPDGYRALLEQLEAGRRVTVDASALVEEALAVWAKPGFETIASLARLRFEPFPYQLEAAQVALRRMRGRAILADEVGLGKTIEAALVLSELRVRGLASRVLILTPPGLLEQWQQELDRKFALPSLLVQGGSWEPTFWSGEDPAVIASLPSARNAPAQGRAGGGGLGPGHRGRGPSSEEPADRVRAIGAPAAEPLPVAADRDPG